MEHIERLALIVLLNIAFFYKTLFYGYVGDDVERSERKEPIFKNRWHSLWIQFVGLRHVSSLNAHFLTIVTHTICSALIYCVFGMNELSFLASVLFSINPSNIQGSVWISGRNYVTSTILTLLMFWFAKFSLVFYAATSYFAVNAWFAPLAFSGTPNWRYIWIVPFVWLFTQHNRQTIHRKLWETGGLKTTNSEMRAIKPSKFIPFIKTYVYYFALALFPFHIGIEHVYLRGFGTNKTDNEKGYKIDLPFILGCLVFGFVMFLSYLGVRHGWNMFSFGLFWFTINIAMWCNFVTYQQHISERYLYLANVGMMLSLASVLINYPFLIGLFLGIYGIRLWFISDMYLNDYWAVEHTIGDSKKLYYMWLMRGVKKFVVKDYMGAIYDFNEAYIHKPYDLKTLYNLSTTYFVLGDIVKARVFFEKAKENIYDELGDGVKPAFDRLEGLIKKVEEAKGRGETQLQIDMKDLVIVK